MASPNPIDQVKAFFTRYTLQQKLTLAGSAAWFWFCSGYWSISSIALNTKLSMPISIRRRHKELYKSFRN